MKRLSNIFNRLAMVAVIIFSLLIIATSLNIFGFRSYVDVSGSMSPAIATGSMVFDRPAGNYKKGDIITFRQAGSQDTITHRIIDVMSGTGSVAYKVKGDANAVADPELVPKSSIVGKVLFALPYIGYFVSFLKTLPGLLILIIIPATIIIYRELVNISKEVSNIRSKRNAKSSGRAKPGAATSGSKFAGIALTATAGLLLASLALTDSGTTAATRSVYSDTTGLSGIAMTTGSWPSPNAP